jgi:hypothetical protein
MIASGTDLRSLFAFMEITTIAATPDHRFIFFEDFASLDISQEAEVSFLVLFLSDRNGLKDH